MSERVLLVGLSTRDRPRHAVEESMAELHQLAEAAGGDVVDHVIQSRSQIDPASYIGKGKVQELARRCEEERIVVVMFDDPLSPAQLRQLEGEIGRLVMDRNQLILDIFATRARSREGQYQVELAQLEYLLPRLVGRGVDLSRLGAGIGTRGPGETKLEIDRRKIRNRISKIRHELERVEEQRQVQSRRRRESALPEISLVGYTNAGKSTLFRAVTGEDVTVSSKPFSTLDPLVRRIELPEEREALLSDTVGFIRKLPHTLVAAFRATLDQVRDADLLINVIDASAGVPEDQVEAVEEVLAELEARDVPRIDVLNKLDLVDDPRRVRAMVPRFEHAVVASALNGDGLDELRQRIVEVLGRTRQRTRFRIPQAEGDLIALLYEEGRVLDRSYEDGAVVLEAEVAPTFAARYRVYVDDDANVAAV